MRGLNAVANGAYLLVSLADGTVRWLSQSDGREQLAYFPHNNGRDWVLWRPDGYYASSDAGDQYVGWHVNRGMDQEPDFYRAVQFERVFYRPDLVRSALGGEPIRMRGGRPVAAGAAATAVSAPSLESELESIAPARLAIEETRTRINVRGRVEITLKVAASARTLPMQQLAVYVNDLPVTPTRQRALSGEERLRLERTITVESDQAQNDIRVEIDHGRSLGLVETYTELSGASPPRAAATLPTGKLIVLAIGIDRFVNVPATRKDELQDLEFAAKDAQAFGEALQRSTRGLFSEVKAVVLNDGSAIKPDKSEIRKALSLLNEAGPDETVILFLASHGFSDRAGNYFFMPRDGRIEDVVNVVESRNAIGKAPSLIEGNEFFDALRQSAGRRMLIVDTCHAKRIDGSLDTHSLRKRSAASNFAFMVAASGEEDSQEYAPGGHGLFTYALLESLKGSADVNNDGLVTLNEAFQYLAPLVQKLRAPKLKQTPQLTAPIALMEQRLVTTSRDR